MRGTEQQWRGFSCPREAFDAGYLDALTQARSARLAELFLKCFGRELRAQAPDLAEVVEAYCAHPGHFPESWPAAIGEMRAALLARPLDPHAALTAAAHLAEARGARAESQPALAWVRGVPLRALELPDGLVPTLQPDVAAYEAAFEIIETAAPLYLPWVERVVHTIVPVESRPGATTSSSFEMLPGVVALSHASPAICLADTLVHEASHQHFYLLTQLGPVHDGSDTGLYYSPGPRTERPIDKILLAYHAFANILLFYRECRQARATDDSLSVRPERWYEERVAVLDAPLRRTSALTPIGRALYEPLALRVASARREDDAVRGEVAPCSA